MPGRMSKRKRTHLGELSNHRVSLFENENGLSGEEFLEHAAQWNLEQDYEQRPRKLGKREKEDTRLPIINAEGRVERLPVPILEDDEKEDSVNVSEEEKEKEEPVDVEIPETPVTSVRQQVLEAKEELAKIALLISENPEEHFRLFKKLHDIADTDTVPIKKLALATQLAVYKDIIPGYQIRPLSETEKATKVSKEVRRLRDFEQSLVVYYQKYVKDLASTSRLRRGNNQADETLVTVAIGCACALLTSVPHFNFRGELISIVVDRLSIKVVDDVFIKCRNAIEVLFLEDEDGAASLDAVRLLSKMMRAKEYAVEESVLNTFLSLRLLSELSVKGSQNSVEDVDKQDEIRGKNRNGKREFRSKKQRKLDKERKAIEKELREADASVSHEMRNQNQSETLKLVFGTYFRILKARIPSLMGAVLEGLAKYSHLINQDFFGDILEALRDMIIRGESPDTTETLSNRNISREILLCIITAFALLEGQDISKAASALHLDLSFFITRLYRNLYPLALNPDIETNTRMARSSDSNASETQASKINKINVQTTTVLLLRALTSVLLPERSTKAVPPIRVAAFSKQLLTSSLQMPEKSCLATLGLMNRVGKTHGSKIARMWVTEERKGDGIFNALGGEIESSNPFATSIWEGELLRKHYCPSIREEILNLEATISDLTKA